jgi:hypothetical protein
MGSQVTQLFKCGSLLSQVLPLRTQDSFFPALTPNGLIPDLGVPNVGCVLPFTSVHSFSQWHSSIPDWLTLVKARPQDGENVVTLHRDNQLALDFNQQHLPGRAPAGCTGIKVLATGSVKNCANTTGNTMLEFRIRLHGATTKQLSEHVCTVHSLSEARGKTGGVPGLIDFKTDSGMIERMDPEDGSMRVGFVFCCYPKDYRLGDTEYL